MIYYYKHKGIFDYTPEEINLFGYEGVEKYALEHNINPEELFATIKKLEFDIEHLQEESFDMSSGNNLHLMNKWVDRYIDYFNRCASHDKQAYVLLGNIATGKSTYASQIEQSTHSIIVDSDRFKMGEQTENGFFEGFTSLYQKDTDRERLQTPCSEACKKTLNNVAETGMNIILPKATSTLNKLENQLDVLVKKDYDIHLILLECPLKECANRSYYRYLIKEYQHLDKLKTGEHHKGRFVPVSVITNIGDGSYDTFIKAKNKKLFKSYNAFYNGNNSFESIDLESIQPYK